MPVSFLVLVENWNCQIPSKKKKKKAVGHISSSVFQIQKNMDRLDKLQVNTQTVQSREVDPNQTKSPDLKVPTFHRHLDPDPKISVGPICTKGWIKIVSKSPFFSSSSLSSEGVWIWNQVWTSLLTSFFSWVVGHSWTKTQIFWGLASKKQRFEQILLTWLWSHETA